ncbi:MAG: Y-family DNA polymerase [Pseudomonadota bacterium]
MSQIPPSNHDRAVPPAGEGAFWLALRFPEAWFESRCVDGPCPADRPAVLIGGRSEVVAVNTPAARLGLHPGQTRLAAQSRFHDVATPGMPELRFLEPDAHAVSGWLEQLAEQALQYTSRVCLPVAQTAPGLLLEVGHSAAAFGGIDHLLSRLLGEIREQVRCLHSALAPHPRVAWALARVAADAEAANGRPGMVIRDRSRQIEAVCRLPLSALDWPVDQVERFEEMGVSTLGQLRRLPRDGVAMRASSALLDDLDRLFGERDWSLPAFIPPECFEREVDLWDPAMGVERLLLLSRGALVALANFLRRRQRVLAAFEVSFTHESDRPTVLTVRSAETGRDERVWMEQLRLRLQSLHDLPPVHRIRVYADRFTVPSAGQRSLFTGAAEREQDELRLWHRLQARLGEEALARVEAAPAIEPPRQSRTVEIGTRSVDTGVKEAVARPERPFWWLDAPVFRHVEVRRWEEVERIRTGWWSAEPETADYRPATLADGRVVWLCRESDASGGHASWGVIGLGG